MNDWPTKVLQALFTAGATSRGYLHRKPLTCLFQDLNLYRAWVQILSNASFITIAPWKKNWSNLKIYIYILDICKVLLCSCSKIIRLPLWSLILLKDSVYGLNIYILSILIYIYIYIYIYTYIYNIYNMYYIYIYIYIYMYIYYRHVKNLSNY